MALQEILLSGCPTVGVRTGAPFIEHGMTGFFVDRLPPGQREVVSDDQHVALQAYMDTVRRSQLMDRAAIHDRAVTEFGTQQIAAKVVTSLAAARAKGETWVAR